MAAFPRENRAKPRVVTVSVDGATARRFDVELADADPDWWAPLDISAWKGKSLRLVADVLPEGSKAFEKLPQSDAFLDSEHLYKESLRPQLQFSTKRGWVNDPNGLVFYRGEYHLFYQHNPYGWNWGNMHWGHATSRDLIHWQEHGEALYPDDMGPMFSGSAVVDWKNHSGLGKDGQPPMLLFYTAAGNPTTQCLAYSLDGRTFTKYAGNPIIKQVTPGNRDPKVIWHEPSQNWVLTLYVEVPRTNQDNDGPNAPKTEHVIQFFTSKNLKDWTFRSQTPGLFECPDFFALPVDGDKNKEKWILTGASSEYFVGSFEGEKFTPETQKLPGHRGRGFYAAQTYSDVPDGRRIQIGWGQAPSPKMSFNQLQTIPCELTLRGMAHGPQLRWQPVKEFATLRSGSPVRVTNVTLKAGDPNPLRDLKGELLEIRATLRHEKDSQVLIRVRGVDVLYDATKQEIVIGNHRASAPLLDGEQRLIVVIDRTMLTVWASDGLTYIPWPVIPADSELNASITMHGAPVEIKELEGHVLRSIWETPQK
jgi:fructan beta-fructosidase